MPARSAALQSIAGRCFSLLQYGVLCCIFQTSFAVDTDEVAGSNKKDTLLKHVVVVAVAAFVILSCGLCNRQCLKLINSKPVVQRAASRLSKITQDSLKDTFKSGRSKEDLPPENKACKEPATIVDDSCPEIRIDIMPPDTLEAQQSQQTAPPPEIRMDIEPSDGPELQEPRLATPSVSSGNDTTSEFGTSRLPSPVGSDCVAFVSLLGSDSIKASPSFKGANKSRASIEKKDKKKRLSKDQKDDVAVRPSVGTASVSSAKLLAVPSESKKSKHRDNLSRSKRNGAEDAVPVLSPKASQASSALRPPSKRPKDKGTFQTN